MKSKAKQYEDPTDKQQRALYANDNEGCDFDWINDGVFLSELYKRSNDYKTGKVKGIPWEEARKK